jgi:hypothetical protein
MMRMQPLYKVPLGENLGETLSCGGHKWDVAVYVLQPVTDGEAFTVNLTVCR